MDNFQEQVLYVGEIDTENLDLSDPPATGEEYIKRVILEARQCQDVVVKPIGETRTKQTVPLEIVETSSEIPKYLLPNKEWQELQIKDFSNVRLYIAELRSKKELLFQMTKNTPKELPEIEEEKSWLRLCSGDEDTSNYIAPKLNMVLSLSQPATERILDYLINYVKDQGRISQNIGRWIYALLVSLEMPLNPDTYSSLRLLAKTCHKIRINMNTIDFPEMNILNLFICLVSIYFRQLDLVDQ